MSGPVAVIERKVEHKYEPPVLNKTQKVRAKSTCGNLIPINLYDEGKGKLGATGLVTDMGKGLTRQRESNLAESTRSSHEELPKMEEGDERKSKGETHSHVGYELFGGRI